VIIPVSSVEDERLNSYRDLPKANLTALSGKFVVEGKLLVDRLVTSKYPVESIVVDERRMSLLPENLADQVPVYVLPGGLVEELIGFNFHRGILACGKRSSEVTSKDNAGLLSRSERQQKTATFVVCVDIQDPTNLGGILRNCAAFGVHAVLLSRNCADPFSRRVLRVSMGAVFQLQIIQSAELLNDLEMLRDRHSVELVATVLDSTAEPLPVALRADRTALLFGNEGHGLAEKWISTCQRRVTLSMANGTDSLNAAAASAVFLYHFTHVAGQKSAPAKSAD
jgi:tRNA G18 (ribose-2'-O)-methylase SpoU